MRPERMAEKKSVENASLEEKSSSNPFNKVMWFLLETVKLSKRQAYTSAGDIAINSADDREDDRCRSHVPS